MVSRDLSRAYFYNDNVLLWCRSCTWYESGFAVEVRSLAVVSSQHVVFYNADHTRSLCICAWNGYTAVKIVSTSANVTNYWI